MIIIWGWRVIGRKVGEGTFFCPSCGADRAYVLKRLRNWFTIFWIPIIPLNSKGDAVRCESCKTMYRTDVLTIPTSARLSETVRDGTRASAVVVLAAGDPADRAGRATAIEAVRAAGLPLYGEADLDADLARPVDEALGSHIASLAAGLADPGKEAFLRQIAGVAAAPGAMAGEQVDLLHQLGAALGLSPAHVTGVVATAAGGGAPAAWYPDPSGAPGQRWWDGQRWTDHVQP